MHHSSSFRRVFVRQRPIQRLPLLCASICLSLLFIYLLSSPAEVRDDYDSKDVYKGSSKLRKITVIGKDDMNGVGRRKRTFSDSTGCNFPKLETWGAELKEFIAKVKPLSCSKRQKNWVYLDEESKFRFIEERKDAVCEVSYLQRDSDFKNSVKESKKLVEGEPMSSEFGRVSCKNGSENWSLPFLSAVRDEELVAQLKGKKPSADALSVLLLGFDSTSHQHFLRKMPKSAERLEAMGAVTMNGYNIVGDGTPQAYIPILTGKTELELPNTRRRYQNATFVDVYPFVWNNFSEKGYVTTFAEEAFSLGMFTYRLKGFDKQPTHHYTRNFYKEAEAAAKGRAHCLGSEEAYKTWFRYPSELLQRYSDVPKFMVFHQDSLSHDDINLIEVQDEYFAEQMTRWEEKGLLDRTVLIVMADHGHRFTKIRNTHQGQLEERLALFSIVLPKKFRETERGKKVYENLLRNRDLLTTPFDVHATFLDILDMPADVSTVQETKSRSLSMLRPIPKTRTCEDAGVEAHWCTCLNWQDAMETEKDREETKMLANGLVEAIDLQLANVRDLCARVRLKDIIYARKLTPNEKLLKYNNVKDNDGFVPKFEGNTTAKFAHYLLKVTTLPNDAIYEATLYYDGLASELEVDLQSLSHVNAYGDDPHCVVKKHHTLTLYCVCRDRVRRNE